MNHINLFQNNSVKGGGFALFCFIWGVTNIENEELVALIQSGVQVRENMGKLYEQNQKFIQAVCTPFTKRCELGDLMQEAYFGLVKAVEGYDSNKGYLFLTYAKSYIRAACITYVKKYGSVKRIPTYMQTNINRYLRMVREQGTEPDPQTVMQELELTEKQYANLMRFINEQQIVSIDEPLDEEGHTVENTIPDKTDLEADYIRQDSANHIWQLVDNTLSGRKRDVIVQHFKQEESLTDIAKREGVSTQAVSLAMKEAIDILSRIDELEEYAAVFGYDSAIAYSGSRNVTEFIATKNIQIDERRQRLNSAFNRRLARV